MRTVGHRKLQELTFAASAELLVASARINDSLRRFPGAGSTFIPKGLYRFATHEDADEHRLACLARGMARLANKRR
jgi:hypothetical protein